jgi:DNA repair exonuclease SbcCD ATPase subunit
MRVLNVMVENFGSYPAFSMDQAALGLALIYGPTGSGKSTIQDMVCWVLYGLTAKDGNVDEVRSWQAGGAPTKGTVNVELPGGTISVTRIRGKQSENDLYWTEAAAPDDFKRGKDLAETQRLLGGRLGCSAELYLTGAYYHEFSATGQFFNAKAKDRRALFERIANLELPVLLAARASDARKSAKSDLGAADTARAKASGRCEQLRSSHADAVQAATQWEARRTDAVADLRARSQGFDLEKSSRVQALQTRSDRWAADHNAQLEALCGKIEAMQDVLRPEEEFDAKAEKARTSSRCSSCGALPEKATDAIAKIMEAKAKNSRTAEKIEDSKAQLSRLLEEENPYLAQIEQAEAAINPYDAQAEAKEREANPFTSQLSKLKADAETAQAKLTEAERTYASLEHRVASLTRLYDLSFQLRGELLKKAVMEIEESTNRYLETYFDAELRVAFTLDGDDLEVSIQKSGYDCVYRQLSKGQRGLLKLAFVVSVMKAAANSAGVHFGQLYFDEALDGLDSELKVRAFSLFEELSMDHESVLLIDHSTELQTMFARRYRIQLNGDVSTMDEESET